MLKRIMSFLRREDGASAIEYGLIVGLIAVAILIVLSATGTNLAALFDRISGALTGS